MNWWPFLAIFLSSITASFATSDEFSPKTNYLIGVSGGIALVAALIWNFFLNGLLDTVPSLVFALFIYSVAKRSH